MRTLADKTTVESCLEIALHEAGFLQKLGGDDKQYDWQRCSRTDKGVHAAYNGISVKINILDDFVDMTKEEIAEEKKKDDRKVLKSKIKRDVVINMINKLLDQDIRCYGR